MYTIKYEAISDNPIVLMYRYIYRAVFESQNELFLYRDNGDTYNSGRSRIYRVGAFVNGICRGLSSENKYGTSNVSYTHIKENKKMPGQEISEYGRDSYNFNLAINFIVYSENAYSCDCYVFDSLNSAQIFYDTGDTRGVIKAPIKVFDTFPNVIKDLYLTDGTRKSVRIGFPNKERSDILPNSILSESFSFTESVCTQRELRFGLAESSIVEFECVWIENIEGCEIEIFLEIDISSLPDEMIEEYGSHTEYHNYPFFCFKLGTFKVDTCERQADMKKRKVVAYSDMLNFDIKMNPFEKAKWDAKFASNTPYTFNPAQFAICNVTHNANLSLDTLGYRVFNGITTLKSELVESSVSPALYNGYNTRLGEDIGVKMKVEVKKWDLLKYVDYNLMLAYKLGDIETAESTIIDSFKNIIYPYRDRISAYELFFDKVIETISNYCHPVGFIGSYSKKSNGYNAVYAYMNNDGFIIPKFSGFKDNFYGIWLPYRVTFEINQWVQNSTYTKVIESYTYDLCDKEGIDVVNVENSVNVPNRLFIPNILTTASRSKNSTGEFVLDTKQCPNTMEVFKALLELNGCFLRHSGKGLFHFHFLNSDNGIYPSEELYPGSDLCPGELLTIIKQSEYMYCWYSEKYVEPYTELKANYKDNSGNDLVIVRHKAEYEDNFNELISDIYASHDTSYNVDEITINLLSGNPLADGMTVYVDCGGLSISYVSVKSGGDCLFEISLEPGTSLVKYEADNWSAATRIDIGVQTNNVEFGTSFNISIGQVTSEEVQKEYKTLDLSSNFLISNYAFTEEDISEMFKSTLDAICEIKYMPTEIELKGMPWIRAGDNVYIDTNDGTINTFVLQRNLTGIMSLHDNFESK